MAVGHGQQDLKPTAALGSLPRLVSQPDTRISRHPDARDCCCGGEVDADQRAAQRAQSATPQRQQGRTNYRPHQRCHLIGARQSATAVVEPGRHLFGVRLIAADELLVSPGSPS
jgi:hypothetical protein